jgi:hypothetical protein
VRTRTLLLALVLLCALPALALAKTTETAGSGPVTATLTYDVDSSGFDARNVRLAITRDGTTGLDQTVREPCKQCAVVPAGLRSGVNSLTIKDLDGDGEPEVLFDMYTGGAHCCSFTWIYRFTGSTYLGTPAVWGNSGYTLVDLDGNGTLELRSFDDVFAYEFTDYADSAFPPLIYSFKPGALTDVTHSFPKIISADAKVQLRRYKRLRHRRDIRGVVAAYVADEYLLGKQAKGLKLATLANHRGDLNGLGRGDTWPRNGKFIRTLKKFLRGNGYAG